MICIIALIVFGILGIFSARYRLLAKEAVDCVFRRITFRKCNSRLDQRLKSQITGTIMRKSQKTGRFVYRYFEVFSWILLILMLVSTFYAGKGIYYYARYGNCNGPDSNEFCIFNPHGLPDISRTGNTTQVLIAPSILDEEGIGPLDAPITLIEFGCYTCPYTKQAEPVLQEILQKYNGSIRFYYLNYPILAHSYSMDAARAGECAREQDHYMAFRERLFELNPVITSENVRVCCEDLGMDLPAFYTCMNATQTQALIDRQVRKGQKSGVYGTPTFFVNGIPLVGPKGINRMDSVIKDELAKVDSKGKD
jgi:protein-disulfide isomerase